MSSMNERTNDKKTVDLHSRRKYMFHGDTTLYTHLQCISQLHVSHNVLLLYATLINKHIHGHALLFYRFFRPFITSYFFHPFTVCTQQDTVNVPLLKQHDEKREFDGIIKMW